MGEDVEGDLEYVDVEARLLDAGLLTPDEANASACPSAIHIRPNIGTASATMEWHLVQGCAQFLLVGYRRPF